MANDSTLKRVFRPFRSRAGGSNGELSNPLIAGAAILLVVLIPLLPVFVVAWGISRTLHGVRKRVSWE